MLRLICILFCVGFILTSCTNNLKSKDDQIIGNWFLSEAYNLEGQRCLGLDESKNCIYNKDQTWSFKRDSSFVTKFTSFVNVNFGDTITLTGKYKTYEDGIDNFLEITYDRFTDSSKIQKFKIINLTDSIFEYSKRKYDDGSGGMRFIFNRPNTIAQ